MQDQSEATAKMMEGARTLSLNAHMQAVDDLVRALPAAEAMGVLMIAQALSFRRLSIERGARTLSQKQTLLRFATRDFQSKITQHGFTWAAANESPVSQVREIDSTK